MCFITTELIDQLASSRVIQSIIIFDSFLIFLLVLSYDLTYTMLVELKCLAVFIFTSYQGSREPYYMTNIIVALPVPYTVARPSCSFTLHATIHCSTL